MCIWLIAAAGMIVIWYVTTPDDYFWPAWPIGTLAVAAAIWGISVYGLSPFRVTDSQVDKEFEKLRTRSE